MNLELVSVIIEALGATGIIATLLYIATETRLHTKQIQGDSLQASIGSLVRQILHVSENPENSIVFRRGLHDFTGQDVANQNGFHAMMLGFVSAYNRTWRLHLAGLIDDEEIQANQRTLVGILRSPGASAWWASWKQEPPQDLTSHIDSLMTDTHQEVEAWSRLPLFRLQD